MTQRQSQVNVSTTHKTDLLTIKQFADLARTTPRTLRFYEQEGLFMPVKIDSNNGYRYYNPRQTRDLLKIKLLQKFNLPLKRISTRLQNPPSLAPEVKTLEREIEAKKKELKFLKEVDKLLTEKDYFQKRVRKETIGPYILFCVYLENAGYDKIPEGIKDLWVEAERQGLNCIKSELTFYPDYWYRPKDAPLELALIVKSNKIPKGLRLPKNYYLRIFPQTKILAFHYFGPYSYMAVFYQKFYDYLDQLKVKNKNGVFEKYLKGPLNKTKSAFDYHTLIGFPLKLI